MPLLKRNDAVSVYEKAVSWNDSVLGGTSKGIFNAFSWIGSNIKKGLQKRKINSLVMQWGLEYVKALNAFDTGKEVVNSFDTEEETTTDEPASTTLEGDNLESFNILYSLFEPLAKEGGEFKKHFSNSTMIGLKNLQTYLDDLLTKIHFDSDVFEKRLKDLLAIYPNDKVLTQFNILNKVIIELGENINEDTDLYQRLQSLFPSMLDKYVPTESKLPELKKNMGAMVLNSVDVIFNYLNGIKKTLNTTKPIQPVTTKPEEPTTESIKFDMLLEAKEFEIPESVTQLFPKEKLEVFEKVDGIKEKTLPKINIKTLDTLAYEAAFVINKAKSGKNKEATADELQRLWDLGIKNINNYFQNVIDTDKVMRSIKTGEIPTDIKSKIEATTEAIDLIPKLGLLPLSPTNIAFKNKELYSFNINLIGQNGKKIKNAYILLSPMAELKEEATGTTYFWFKLFGQYSVNAKGEIVRINLFNGLTNSKSIVDNFNNVENAYIVCFESLKVSNKMNNMWIYSNKGGTFFDGKVYKDSNEIIDDITRLTIKDWLKLGNIFRYYVNSRLAVDKQNLKRFPGIQEKDLIDETSSANAKKNHDIIINNLQK